MKDNNPIYLSTERKSFIKHSAESLLSKKGDEQVIPPNMTIADRLKIISPKNLVHLTGFIYEEHENLGDSRFNKQKYECAGLINPQSNKIAIAWKYPEEDQKFTLAHEIGHAILHPGIPLHKDKPLNNFKNEKVNIKEVEANYFASCLLMPELLFLHELKVRFLTSKFRFHEHAVVSLGKDIGDFPSLDFPGANYSREIVLASSTRYNNVPFESLVDLFGVSEMVVARRIRELNYIIYP